MEGYVPDDAEGRGALLARPLPAQMSAAAITSALQAAQAQLEATRNVHTQLLDTVRALEATARENGAALRGIEERVAALTVAAGAAARAGAPAEPTPRFVPRATALAGPGCQQADWAGAAQPLAALPSAPTPPGVRAHNAAAPASPVEGGAAALPSPDWTRHGFGARGASDGGGGAVDVEPLHSDDESEPPPPAALGSNPLSETQASAEVAAPLPLCEPAGGGGAQQQGAQSRHDKENAAATSAAAVEQQQSRRRRQQGLKERGGGAREERGPAAAQEDEAAAAAVGADEAAGMEADAGAAEEAAAEEYEEGATPVVLAEPWETAFHYVLQGALRCGWLDVFICGVRVWVRTQRVCLPWNFCSPRGRRADLRCCFPSSPLVIATGPPGGDGGGGGAPRVACCTNIPEALEDDDDGAPGGVALCRNTDL